MLIRICGNCKSYIYHNPAANGGCPNNKKAFSPLSETCPEFQPKKNRS